MDPGHLDDAAPRGRGDADQSGPDLGDVFATCSAQAAEAERFEALPAVRQPHEHATATHRPARVRVG